MRNKINLFGKYPVELKGVEHRDGTESLFCWTKLSNGKTLKMEAKLEPLEKVSENGHEWQVSCHGWSTNSYAINRWRDASEMFVSHIDLMNSMIEANKYVKVTVMIPKGKYCNSPLSCPLFNDGSGFEYTPRCNYSDVDLKITRDERTPKHEKCPALK